MVLLIIGKDTRVSGNMIEAAIASGICSMKYVKQSYGQSFLFLKINSLVGI